MIIYFWYLEDGRGNKLNCITQLYQEINKDNFNSVVNSIYNDVFNQHVIFDRNSIQLKSLSRL